MIRKLRAVYRDGVFRPAAPCDLPENAEVELLVRGPATRQPTVSDREKRPRVPDRVAQRMQNNPLPPAAPRYTRDELHERR